VKNRLRVLRAERNWTQQDLADHAGVSRQTIHAVESEKYDPSLPLAFTLSRLFGVTIEEVFLPDGELVPGGPQRESG
jgi:putative transcriptional regulator